MPASSPTAAVADGADLVIVWGGDGTVNEVGVRARRLEHRARARAGRVGQRAGGVAVRAARPAAALDRMLSAPPAPSTSASSPAGRSSTSPASASMRTSPTLFNLRERGRRGKWPYVMIGVREGWRYRALDYDRRARRRGSSSVTALLVAFANGREYGMGACISPGAELDDGLLEATIVEDRSSLARFVDARHLALRSIARAAARADRAGAIGGRHGPGPAAAITSTGNRAWPAAAWRSGSRRGRSRSGRWLDAGAGERIGEPESGSGGRAVRSRG